MAENTVDTALLNATLQQIRGELAMQGRLLAALVDLTRATNHRLDETTHRIDAIDRRFGEQTSELEVIITGEMLGSRTNFETAWEDRSSARSNGSRLWKRRFWPKPPNHSL